MILRELGLPADLPTDERLGRLRKQHGFEMHDVQEIVQKHREQRRTSGRRDGLILKASLPPNVAGSSGSCLNRGERLPEAATKPSAKLQSPREPPAERPAVASRVIENQRVPPRRSRPLRLRFAPPTIKYKSQETR